MTPRGILLFGLGLGLGVGLGLGIHGRILGRGGTSAENTAASSADSWTVDQATGSADVLQHCYRHGGSPDQAPLLRIGERTLALQDLPLTDQARLVRLAEDGWLRQNQVLEDLALRLSLSEGKEDVSSTVELADFAKAAAKVSDAEVTAFYQANKASFPKHLSFDKVKPTIVAHLESQKRERWIDERRAEFRQKSPIQDVATLSCPPRVNVKFSDFPAVGGEDGASLDVALLTQPFCLSCRTLWPQVDLLRKASKGSFRLRPVPVILRESQETDTIWAKAQHCASREGSDRLVAWLDVAHRAPLELRDRTSDLMDWIKTKGATDAQLGVDSFVACLDSKDAETFVKQARDVVEALGVSRAPLAYVHGRRLVTRGSHEGDIREALEALSKAALAL